MNSPVVFSAWGSAIVQAWRSLRRRRGARWP